MNIKAMHSVKYLLRSKISLKAYITILALLFLTMTGSNNLYSQEPLFAPEYERFMAMQNQDSIGLTKMLHEDLVYVHSNGVVENKTSHIRNIMSGYMQYKKMVPEELRIRYYDDMAITIGVVNVTGVFNQNPFELKLRYSATYINNKGTWQLINWQSTKVN